MERTIKEVGKLLNIKLGYNPLETNPMARENMMFEKKLNKIMAPYCNLKDGRHGGDVKTEVKQQQIPTIKISTPTEQPAESPKHRLKPSSPRKIGNIDNSHFLRPLQRVKRTHKSSLNCARLDANKKFSSNPASDADGSSVSRSPTPGLRDRHEFAQPSTKKTPPLKIAKPRQSSIGREKPRLPQLSKDNSYYCVENMGITYQKGFARMLSLDDKAKGRQKAIDDYSKEIRMRHSHIKRLKGILRSMKVPKLPGSRSKFGQCASCTEDYGYGQTIYNEIAYSAKVLNADSATRRLPGIEKSRRDNVRTRNGSGQDQKSDSGSANSVDETGAKISAPKTAPKSILKKGNSYLSDMGSSSNNDDAPPPQLHKHAKHVSFSAYKDLHMTLTIVARKAAL